MLQVHAQNPRYLQFRGRPIVLISSAEHYAAVINRGFDFRAYLDALHEEGMNHTRVFTGVYHEAVDQLYAGNVLGIAADQFACPHPRTAEPGALDGGTKFDLDRWDPVFFERLHAFCTRASERDIVVEINLFCPLYICWGEGSAWRLSPYHPANNVNGMEGLAAEDVYALGHERMQGCQEAYVRKLVTELNGYDNLYFEVCNEPYADRLPEAWQRRITDLIEETERNLPHRHLISWNVRNYWGEIRDPHPAVSILNFHYARPPRAVALNYGLDRVIGCNETGFDGHDEQTYLFQAWSFILAGGGLFNNLDPSFTTEDPVGARPNPAAEDWAGSRDGLRRRLRVLSEFIHGFDFVRMVPDEEAAASDEPGDVVQVLAEPGRQYAVYLRTPYPSPSFDPGLRRLALRLPPGDYTAAWLHPDSGRSEATIPIRADGAPVRLTLPGIREHVALKVVAV